jgi:hypothetical protein
MELKKKLKELILVNFSVEEQAKLAEYAKPIETKMAEVLTVDGKKLSIVGEMPAVGSEVMDITTGTPVSCADGSYELEGGKVIKVAAGKIAEIVDAPQETEEQMKARQMAEAAVPQLAQMSVQMTAIKAENDTLKAELSKRIDELNKQSQFMASQLEKILNAPIQLSGQSEDVEMPDFSTMTASEEREWKRKYLNIK